MNWTTSNESTITTAQGHGDGPGQGPNTSGSSWPKPHPCAPRRPARLKTTKIPWDAVRQRYVTGVSGAVNTALGTREWSSLAEVAREFGASLGRVEAVSARDRWPEQRESFRQRLRAEEDRLLLKRLGSKRVRARYAAFMLAGQILDLVEARLKQGDISPRELASLARAALKSQEISEAAINGFLGKPLKPKEAKSKLDYSWP